MPPIKSRSDQKTFKKAAAIAGRVCDQLMTLAQPGVATQALEDAANELLAKERATAPFKQFDDFGFAICASLNHEVVNGIPSTERVLKDGDVLKVAIGSQYRGFCGKAARTKLIGDSDSEAKTKNVQQLIQVTRSVFDTLSNVKKDEWSVWDITQTIMEITKDTGYVPVYQSGGYGIGAQLHQDVMILNSATDKESESLKRMILKPGQGVVPMPMLILPKEGGDQDEETGKWTVLEDNWTQALDSGAICSHWAETCWINEEGCFEVLSSSE